MRVTRSRSAASVGAAAAATATRDDGNRFDDDAEIDEDSSDSGIFTLSSGVENEVDCIAQNVANDNEKYGDEESDYDDDDYDDDDDDFDGARYARTEAIEKDESDHEDDEDDEVEAIIESNGEYSSHSDDDNDDEESERAYNASGGAHNDDARNDSGRTGGDSRTLLPLAALVAALAILVCTFLSGFELNFLSLAMQFVSLPSLNVAQSARDVKRAPTAATSVTGGGGDARALTAWPACAPQSLQYIRHAIHELINQADIRPSHAAAAKLAMRAAERHFRLQTQTNTAVPLVVYIMAPPSDAHDAEGWHFAQTLASALSTQPCAAEAASSAATSAAAEASGDCGSGGGGDGNDGGGTVWLDARALYTRASVPHASRDASRRWLQRSELALAAAFSETACARATIDVRARDTASTAVAHAVVATLDALLSGAVDDSAPALRIAASQSDGGSGSSGGGAQCGEASGDETCDDATAARDSMRGRVRVLPTGGGVFVLLAAARVDSRNTAAAAVAAADGSSTAGSGVVDHDAAFAHAEYTLGDRFAQRITTHISLWSPNDAP